MDIILENICFKKFVLFSSLYEIKVQKIQYQAFDLIFHTNMSKLLVTRIYKASMVDHILLKSCHQGFIINVKYKNP